MVPKLIIWFGTIFILELVVTFAVSHVICPILIFVLSVVWLLYNIWLSVYTLLIYYFDTLVYEIPLIDISLIVVYDETLIIDLQNVFVIVWLFLLIPVMLIFLPLIIFIPLIV